MVIGKDGLIFFNGIFKSSKLIVPWSDVIEVNLEEIKQKETRSFGGRVWMPVATEVEIPCLRIKMEESLFFHIKETVAQSIKHFQLDESSHSLKLLGNKHFQIDQIMELIEEYKPVEKGNIELDSSRTHKFIRIILSVIWIFTVLTMVLCSIWMLNSFFSRLS